MCLLSIMYGVHPDPEEGLKKAAMVTKSVLKAHEITQKDSSNSLHAEKHCTGAEASLS